LQKHHPKTIFTAGEQFMFSRLRRSDRTEPSTRPAPAEPGQQRSNQRTSSTGAGSAGLAPQRASTNTSQAPRNSFDLSFDSNTQPQSASIPLGQKLDQLEKDFRHAMTVGTSTLSSSHVDRVDMDINVANAMGKTFNDKIKECRTFLDKGKTNKANVAHKELESLLLDCQKKTIYADIEILATHISGRGQDIKSNIKKLDDLSSRLANLSTGQTSRLSTQMNALRNILNQISSGKNKQLIDDIKDGSFQSRPHSGDDLKASHAQLEKIFQQLQRSTATVKSLANEVNDLEKLPRNEESKPHHSSSESAAASSGQESQGKANSFGIKFSTKESDDRKEQIANLATFIKTSFKKEDLVELSGLLRQFCLHCGNPAKGPESLNKLNQKMDEIGFTSKVHIKGSTDKPIDIIDGDVRAIIIKAVRDALT
jgi:hypothetical protein